jgi:hypothetical protein
MSGRTDKNLFDSVVQGTFLDHQSIGNGPSNRRSGWFLQRMGSGPVGRRYQSLSHVR